MATTLHNYTGDGTTTAFTVSFDYLSDSYVTFSVKDSTGATDYTENYTGTVSGSTLTISPAPVSGYQVQIKRATSISDDLFAFETGAVIRPDDLGEAMKTLRDYSEEKADQQANAVISAQSDAVSQATATSTAKASQAASSATAAASSASAAASSESAALGYRNTAEEHKDDAQSARDASQTARDASQTAQTAAENAKSAAEAALDQLNNKYHGTHASDTDVVADIDADADLTLEAGDIYFNSTSNMLRYYDGSAWYNAAATQVIDTSALGGINDVTFTSLGGDHFIVRSDQNTWVNVGADVVKDKLGLDSADSPTFAGLTLTGNITTSGQVDGRDVSTDGIKLDGIEANATADMTDAEIKTAYENNSDTNAFTDLEQSKLAGIAANADVTDTTNVTAAGALMDSELADEAAVKGINQALDTNADVDFSSVTVEKILINGRTINSTDTDGDIEITPNGDGDIKLDGQLWPRTAGSDGKVLKVSSQSTGQLEWGEVSTDKFVPVSASTWSSAYTKLGSGYDVYHQKDGNTQTVSIPTGAIGCIVILQAAGGTGGNAGGDFSGARMAAHGAHGATAVSVVRSIDQWTDAQRSAGFSITFSSQGTSGICTVKHGTLNVAISYNGANGTNVFNNGNNQSFAPDSPSATPYSVYYNGSNNTLGTATILTRLDISKNTAWNNRPSIQNLPNGFILKSTDLLRASRSIYHNNYMPVWAESAPFSPYFGTDQLSYNSSSVYNNYPYLNVNCPDVDQNSMMLGEPGLGAYNINQATTYTGGRGGPAGAIFIWYYD